MTYFVVTIWTGHWDVDVEAHGLGDEFDAWMLMFDRSPHWSELVDVIPELGDPANRVTIEVEWAMIEMCADDWDLDAEEDRLLQRPDPGVVEVP